MSENPLHDAQNMVKELALAEEHHKKPVIFVPRHEYNRYGADAVRRAANCYGVIVIPTDTNPISPRDLPAEEIKYKIFKDLDLENEAKSCQFIDDTDIPKERYHDRVFPKDYIKKKKASRRRQKQSKRKNR